MKAFRTILAGFALATTGLVIAPPVAAQMPIVQVGVDPAGVPICDGPRGIAPCHVIMAWLQNQPQQPFMPGPRQPDPWQPNDYQRDTMACYSATGELITGTLCAAGAVTGRTLSKCMNGIGVRGGCFGPSNTLRRVIESPRGALRDFDRSLRRHLRF